MPTEDGLISNLIRRTKANEIEWSQTGTILEWEGKLHDGRIVVIDLEGLHVPWIQEAITLFQVSDLMDLIIDKYRTGDHFSELRSSQ